MEGGSQRETDRPPFYLGQRVGGNRVNKNKWQRNGRRNNDRT